MLHVPDLLFHALGRLRERYGNATALWIQTNGDLLDETMLDRLLDAGIVHIGVSSIDDFHPQETLDRRGYLESLFEARGFTNFSFWGATPDMWIGKIWPRGRAIGSGHPDRPRVSRATPDDKFCDQWSGALGFLNPGAGSEVNIQLAAVYPCCPMTVRPVGDLRTESLESILDRCRDNPVYEALNRGRPAEMGIHLGISEAAARARIEALGNECLWCDEFFLKHYRNPAEPESAIPGGRRDLVQVTRLIGA